MSKQSDRAKLGTRYTCSNCGTRFYDLNRPKAVCPECGTEQKKKDKDDG